jgi:predicted transposase YbfD/YdcC
MEHAGPQATITEYFTELEGPRRHNWRHKLLDIVAIAICGVIGHGRTETRECWSTSDPDYLLYIGTLGAWQGIQSIALVQSERQIGDQTTVTRRYFISSLKSNAKRILHAVRAHWGIENKVHWVLDVAFREDDCRIRKGNGAENFAVLHHIALNLLRRETSAVD